MPAILGMLKQLGGTALNTAFGIGLGKYNDQRQLEQNQKLQEQNYAFDVRRMNEQHRLQKLMWDETNYEAQVKHLEKAGLNAALLYGHGGGGGATTGAGMPGGGGGSGAPSGGREVMDILGLANMKAQQELIQAQTEKTKAEAAKISGVDTANVTADTLVKNGQLQSIELENKLKASTLQEQENIITLTMQKMHEEWNGMVIANHISRETAETEINRRKSELISIGIEQGLKKAQTKLTDKQIWKISEEVAQGWNKLSIEQQNAISQAIATKGNYTLSMASAEGILRGVSVHEGQLRLDQINKDMTDSQKQIQEVITGIIQAVVLKGAAGAGTTRPTIGGFKPR